MHKPFVYSIFIILLCGTVFCQDLKVRCDRSDDFLYQESIRIRGVEITAIDGDVVTTVFKGNKRVVLDQMLLTEASKVSEVFRFAPTGTKWAIFWVPCRRGEESVKVILAAERFKKDKKGDTKKPQ
jgi:hypothetical protein